MIKLEELSDEKTQLGILIISLLLYILTKSSIFGYLIALEIIFFVFVDFKVGAKKRGVKGEILDTLKSLGIALVFWLILSFIFRTPVPISGIVSCSMVPTLHRGDLVLVYGAQPDEIKIQFINMSEEEYNKFVYSPAEIVYNNSIYFKINGSIFGYCYSNTQPICSLFFSKPELFVEKHGNVALYYKKCNRYEIGKNTYYPQVCLDYLEYKNKKYYMNYSNPILVYEPDKGTIFSNVGDIIHRAYLKINVGNKTYFLTQGDNNNVLDTQFYDYNNHLGNLPASKIKGIEVFSIPYIGYLKLFISGYVEEGPLCKTYLRK